MSVRNCAGTEDGGIRAVHESTKVIPGSLLWVHELDVLQPYPRSAIPRAWFIPRRRPCYDKAPERMRLGRDSLKGSYRALSRYLTLSNIQNFVETR